MAYSQSVSVTRHAFYAILLPMRFLGIDYGLKRVGLALSDESGLLAFPYTILKNDKSLLPEIDRVCKEQKVKLIIVGESKDFSGKPNPIAREIEKFKRMVHALTKKKVESEPEFLTSVQAARWPSRRPDGSRGTGRQKANEMVDASAAAIILQSYLDKKRNLAS